MQILINFMTDQLLIINFLFLKNIILKIQKFPLASQYQRKLIKHVN